MVGLSSYTQSSTNVLTTALNSLANNALSAASSAQDNSSNHDFWADFELNCTFGTSPTAGTTIDLYMLISMDGTNYSDGSSSVTPSGAMFVGSFQVRAVTTAQRIHIRSVPLPPGNWEVLVLNNGTGQSFASSGNTLAFRSYKTA